MLDTSIFDQLTQGLPPPPVIRPAGDSGVLLNRVPDQETLRRVGWELGSERAAEKFAPVENHVALAAVSPKQAFANWRMLPEWIENTRRARGDAWHNCRMVLRLYDVSFINFNGFNAHRIQDIPLQQIAGQMIFALSRPGTWQLAEAGFVLRGGEFIPAARSTVVQFPADAVCGRGDHAGLLVNRKLKVEPISNIWEQEAILTERRKPTLRARLRIAALAFEARACGQQGVLANLVTELAVNVHGQGHDVHVFVPRSEQFNSERQDGGVTYHPLDVRIENSPLETARNFARAAEARMSDLPPFDLIHLHEWMTGFGGSITLPTVLSLTSIEATRLNGAAPSELSQEISRHEKELARNAGLVLTPPWLHEKAIAEFGLDPRRVQKFSMEGRVENEWDAGLDLGRVKQDIGFGPLDRLLLFIGPLEHAAGPDLLVDALGVALHRHPSLRIGFIGNGMMHDYLQRRAHEVRGGHAVRLLGHVEGASLFKLLRACEAVILPSRQRVAFDDQVIGLARRAGKAVVTTHSGPGYLVRHEENGLVTYDNPGSMVWALDRVLGDAQNTQRLGLNGRHGENAVHCWKEVARKYLDLCAEAMPELTAPKNEKE